MTNLQIIETNIFNGVPCDVYSDGNRIYMTRQQIGQALGYNNPSDAIELIHRRHKDRFAPFSVTFKLTGTDGKMYNTYLYNQRGIMEICRWSRQPLADKFMDWVWDIIEAYRDGTLVPCPINTPTALTQQQIEDIIDDKLTLFKENELFQLRREYSLLKSECVAINTQRNKADTITPSCMIMPEPIDVIKSTIEPLAKALNDNSKGFTCTYRKVYAAMNISWANRLSRYKNQHGNKNKPSKLRLIADNPKLLKLFVKTVNEMENSL